ncbi:MAG TPA: glutathione S-transferase family protein [Steroidobacteraceae bacterium]|nr:glutathione S-transferase family protein [Steroidobacteraceae bacterium]
MAIDLYWGSGSPFSWRVLLALELKRLQYANHLLQFSKQEQKSPQMLSLNFRGRVPVLKDGDYVVFESLAVLFYLDRKYPSPVPLFGRSPEEAGVIMRVICEFQAYAEVHVMKMVSAFLMRTPGQVVRQEDLAESMHVVASEARSIEARLSKSEWVVGESVSAADIVIFPSLQILLRALAKPEARDLSSRFLPLDVNYPALSRWVARVEALPGYEKTYPPHWRETSP